MEGIQNGHNLKDNLRTLKIISEQKKVEKYQCNN